MERFTKEELEKWWHAQCPKCGWDGLSRDCEGGEPIADTGDFNDPLCPMCIKKDDYVVVDDYAEPDAQATIAALQAELERTKFEMASELELQVNAVVREREQLKAKLTQRTAELHQVLALSLNDNCALGRVETIINDLHAKLERVTGELVETSLYLQQERANRDSLAACVGRDVKTIKELRALILALPKVEGEITANRVCTIMMRGLYCEEFTK